jgi:hypothetical protein
VFNYSWKAIPNWSCHPNPIHLDKITGRQTSGILYTWTRFGKMVHTRLYMVQTWTCMYIHPSPCPGHVHTWTVTVTCIYMHICIYMHVLVHNMTSMYIHACPHTYLYVQLPILNNIFTAPILWTIMMIVGALLYTSPKNSESYTEFKSLQNHYLQPNLVHRSTYQYIHVCTVYRRCMYWYVLCSQNATSMYCLEVDHYVLPCTAL